MKNKHDKEIKMLNQVYSEMIDALINKPNTQDYEASRIYFENVVGRMNDWVAKVNQVKVNLEKAEGIGDLTAENRPA